MNKDSEKYIKVVIDAENYRAKRQKTLEQMCIRDRSRPCLALPPAESPSTRNISERLGSFSEQSASLPGMETPSKTLFLLVSSLAFLAASLALAARMHLSKMILACVGFSSRNASTFSDVARCV